MSVSSEIEAETEPYPQSLAGQDMDGQPPPQKSSEQSHAQNPAEIEAKTEAAHPTFPLDSAAQGVYAQPPPQCSSAQDTASQVSVDASKVDLSNFTLSGPVTYYIGNPNCCAAFCCPETGGFLPCGCCNNKPKECCDGCCDCLDPCIDACNACIALFYDKFRFFIRNKKGLTVYGVWRGPQCSIGLKLHVRSASGNRKSKDYASAERGQCEHTYTITYPQQATISKPCCGSDFKVNGSGVDWDINYNCCGGFKVTEKEKVIMNVFPACCNLIREECGCEYIQIDIPDAVNTFLCFAIIAIFYG